MKSIKIRLFLLAFLALATVSFTLKIDSSLMEEEHSFVLSQDGGREALEKFQQFLDKHFPFKGQVEVSGQASGSRVRRLILKIKNGTGFDLLINGQGFHQFQMKWKRDGQQVFDCYYQFDEQKMSKIPLDKPSKKSRIRVSYSHDSN